MPAREPGWYQDPTDPLRHRYWTGEAWQSECQRLREDGHTGMCPEEAPRGGLD